MHEHHSFHRMIQIPGMHSEQNQLEQVGRLIASSANPSRQNENRTSIVARCVSVHLFSNSIAMLQKQKRLFCGLHWKTFVSGIMDSFDSLYRKVEQKSISHLFMKECKAIVMFYMICVSVSNHLWIICFVWNKS